MKSAKMTTPDFLEMTAFWNKCYDVMVYAGDAMNKLLSRDSYYTSDVFMWPKFGNCSIYMREVIITSIL